MNTPRTAFRRAPSIFVVACLTLLLLAGGVLVPSGWRVDRATAVTAAGIMRRSPTPKETYRGEDQDLVIAAVFAPIIHQSLGEQPRNDYITNFDFDGDWRGDNNWRNADAQRYPRKAHVYFAVSETPTHFFIHYALFHPVDYKGGKSGEILSGLIREGVRRGGQYDPTGLAAEAVLAHENDMEGCLVVAEKQNRSNDPRAARVALVETLSHNRFLKYVPAASPLRGFQSVELEKERVRLYVEPKGHGVEAYGENQTRKEAVSGYVVYNYTGAAGDPEERRDDEQTVGYKLVPLYTTLWTRAQRGTNETYGDAYDYGTLSVSVMQASGRVLQRKSKVGKIGSAFRGEVGASNAARPPWGWFDSNEREQPAGEWFFDPAKTVKRHFGLGEEFSGVYLHRPFSGVFR